ncbi:hypothetical protein AA0119_g9514 [Alternaria tenuissima]|uniref:Core Histone H2A/H2B/H3 domain-containing protein n=1 Tax=Alternaria tenuissima TaxID=119927 RepID=A0A4V1WUP5_9PLEO|nr:hypothetical protein AA0115_g2028 [Alternaria tenuissima]RYN93388.1 hypothetical protein AA0119_g9514 [Alternaria tenuissima]RYO22323.1 hypothetical protein AA0121_g2673 [Alternaria tenuissima]RYO66062.1 hypothetical protein AA0116_g2402 [Alternaria tenuissima]
MRNMFGFLHRPPDVPSPIHDSGHPTTSGKSVGGHVPQIFSAAPKVRLRYDREASSPTVSPAPSVPSSPSPPRVARQTGIPRRSHPAKPPQVSAGKTVPRPSGVAGKSVPKPLVVAGKTVSKSTPTKVRKRTANRVKEGVAIKYNYDAPKAPIFRGHITGPRNVTDAQYLEQEVVHYQRSTGTIIPKGKMVRLVKSAMNAFEGEYQDGHPSKATRMTKDALETIHEALEEVVTAFFIAAQVIAMARKVKTVTPADMKDAARVARILGPYGRLLEEHDFGEPEQRAYVRGPISSGEVASPLRPRRTGDAAYLRRTQAPGEAARPRRSEDTGGRAGGDASGDDSNDEDGTYGGGGALDEEEST